MNPLIRLFGVMALALLCVSPAWALQDVAPVSFHTSATTNATGSVVDVSRYSSIALDISITNTATVTFQSRSSSGGTYQSLQCMNLATGAMVTTATSSIQVQCNVAGLSQFKAPISGCSSCTVVVAGKISTAASNSSGGGGILAILTDVWDAVTHALQVTMVTLLSCEDQTHELCMVSGGKVRSVAMQTAALVNATGSPITGYTGSKSVSATLTCGASDCVGVVTIYGSMVNTQAAGTYDSMCAITFTAAATQTKSCSPITAAFKYFWSDITAMSGTGESMDVTMGY